MRRSLWVLLDGRRGHENQSLGLADALARLGGFFVESIQVPHDKGLGQRLRLVRLALRELSHPRFILAAGHKTHLPLLYAAFHGGGRSIVLMRPSLPEALFDLVIVPSHNLPENARETSKRIITRGALNRMRFDPSAKDGRGLFLIGGPAREHGWDNAAVVAALGEVVKAAPDRQWALTTSRRTPPDFLSAAREQLPAADCYDVNSVSPDWLPDQLLRAEEVWVTRDSVSMVYEALSAGARVGLLDVPLRRKPGKLTRGLERLLRDRFVTEWAGWLATKELPPPPYVLAETDRCATEILRRWG